MALPLTFTSLPSPSSLLLLRRSPPPCPSLSLPPFSSSSSSSRLSPPPLQLQLQFVARASTPDLGRRIQFEQDDPLVLDIDTDTDTNGGQGPDGFDGGSGDNGGGGSGGDGDGEHFEEEEEEEEPNKKKKKMLMSQQFTLAYAALVGVGGIMGFVKKGSMKSAAAGGLSSLLLCYVYTQLPTNPTFASSLGLGISGALLTVMGSRFKKSGKIFPAGVVSLVSLFMTGGYLHAILRAGH